MAARLTLFASGDHAVTTAGRTVIVVLVVAAGRAAPVVILAVCDFLSDALRVARSSITDEPARPARALFGALGRTVGAVTKLAGFEDSVAADRSDRARASGLG